MKTYPREMHTAEHILNQTMVRLFDCGRCFSAHIEKKKSKCDYHFDRPLDDAEVADIVDQVNRIIDADLPVSEKWLPLSEAAALFDLQRLPDESNEKIRIISVGDYDACPCIGDHVRSTGQIGRFRITSTSFNNGTLRVRFKLAARKRFHNAALRT